MVKMPGCSSNVSPFRLTMVVSRLWVCVFRCLRFVLNIYGSRQTDEQAPLPAALSQLLDRVRSGYSAAGEFVFNCQMGRGRTTTGMVTACLIATTINWHIEEGEEPIGDDHIEHYDPMDGPSEEEAYLQGESIIGT
jgi:hypothetical protein